MATFLTFPFWVAVAWLAYEAAKRQEQAPWRARVREYLRPDRPWPKEFGEP